MEAERQQDRRLSPLGPREEAGARGPGSATSLVLPPGALAPFLRSAAGSGQAVGAQCAGQCVGSLPSPPHSAAVVSAISLYMRHLGVRTKSGDKKSGRNFFRKKVLP